MRWFLVTGFHFVLQLSSDYILVIRFLFSRSLVLLLSHNTLSLDDSRTLNYLSPSRLLRFQVRNLFDIGFSVRSYFWLIQRLWRLLISLWPFFKRFSLRDTLLKHCSHGLLVLFVAFFHDLLVIVEHSLYVDFARLVSAARLLQFKWPMVGGQFIVFIEGHISPKILISLCSKLTYSQCEFGLGTCSHLWDLRHLDIQVGRTLVERQSPPPLVQVSRGIKDTKDRPELRAHRHSISLCTNLHH